MIPKEQLIIFFNDKYKLDLKCKQYMDLGYVVHQIIYVGDNSYFILFNKYESKN